MFRSRAEAPANLALAVCLFLAAPINLKRHQPLPPLPPSSYKPVNEFNPKRDPAQDLKDAIVEAKRTKRRILLEVGGDWSFWSNVMDSTFESHPDLQDFRMHNYVTVKVYFGTANANEKFLEQFPRIPDYPHFFVLDSDGKFFHSQRTHKFEEGRIYSVRKIDAFLKKWAPGSPSGMTPDSPQTTTAHKHAR